MLDTAATDITVNTWTHLEIINSALGAPAQHDNTGGGPEGSLHSLHICEVCCEKFI